MKAIFRVNNSNIQIGFEIARKPWIWGFQRAERARFCFAQKNSKPQEDLRHILFSGARSARDFFTRGVRNLKKPIGNLVFRRAQCPPVGPQPRPPGPSPVQPEPSLESRETPLPFSGARGTDFGAFRRRREGGFLSKESCI